MSKHTKVYAVILAGGSGTRFWPKSRQKNPKQFLDMLGQGTLLGQTIRRCKPLIDGKSVFIVTNKTYLQQVKKITKPLGVPHSQILCEPSAKNTAPAIYWAALKINQLDSDAVMVVLPSDHLIQSKSRFQKVLKSAVQLAKKNNLVTFGITPTRPEIGYGYLKVNKEKSCLTVEKFIEKPPLVQAKKYFRQKSYLWNSGMFVWNTKSIQIEFQRQLPKIVSLFKNNPNSSHIQKIWTKLPNISIDYGILENAVRVVAVEAANIGWSDLGSWESLYDIAQKDHKGNYIQGDVLTINSEGSLVMSMKKLVVAIDVKDLIIVDTPDALLITQKTSSQKVKQVVEQLKEQKRKEY